MIGKILLGIVSVSKCMCVTRSRDDGERFQGVCVCVGEIEREGGNVSKGENFHSLGRMRRKKTSLWKFL